MAKENLVNSVGPSRRRMFVSGLGVRRSLRSLALGLAAGCLASFAHASSQEPTAQAGDPVDALIHAGQLAQAEQELDRILAARAELDLGTWLYRVWQRAELARLRWDWSRAARELDLMQEGLAPLLADLDSYYGATAAGIHSLASIAHGSRAQLLIELGCLKQAAAELDKEAEHAAACSDVQTKAMSALHRAALHTVSERYEEAVDTLDSQADSFGALRALASLHIGAASLGLELSDAERPPRAVAELEAALEGGLTRHQRAIAWRMLADARWLLGRDRAGAQQALELALASMEEEAEDSFPEDPRALAQRAFLSASRARILDASSLDAEERMAQYQQVDRTFGSFLEAWAAVERPPGGVGFLQLRERCSIVEANIEWAVHALGQEEGAQQAYEILALVHELGSVAQREKLPAPDLGQVRETLLRGDDHGLLVILPGFESLLLLLVDRQGLTLERAPHPLRVAGRKFAFAQRLRRFLTFARRGLATKEAAVELEQAALELGHMTIPAGARERMQRWSQLTVAGAELLGETPLELYGFEPGVLIGERFALDIVPSLPRWLELATRARPEVTELDLCLLATLDPGQADSPHTAALTPYELQDGDLSTTLAPYEPGRVAQLLGEQASLEALALSRRQRTRVTQFLVHGLYDPAAVRGAGLALRGPDGKLTTLDSAALESLVQEGPGPLVGELTVLAACGPLRGPSREGDDAATHLGSAFLDAGARCVVSSPYALELGSIREVLGRFHAELARGGTIAEALRRARAAARKSDSPPAARWEAGSLRAYGEGHFAPFPAR